MLIPTKHNCPGESSAPPTYATPTSATNRSPPPEHYANSTASAKSLDTGGRHVQLVTRRTPLQAAILGALDVDTADWDRAHIT